MKTLKKTFLLAGAALCFTTGAYAQNNASGTDSSYGSDTNESSRTMNNNDRTTNTDSTMNSDLSNRRSDGSVGMNDTYSSNNLSQTQIQDVQRALSDQGYSVTADGIWGDQTTTSLRRFQKENNLNETGTLDSQTLTALELEFNNDARGGVRASGSR